MFRPFLHLAGAGILCLLVVGCSAPRHAAPTPAAITLRTTASPSFPSPRVPGTSTTATAEPPSTSTPTTAAIDEAWAALRRRPLHLPTLAARQACPLSPGQDLVPGIGSLHGAGPVYLNYDGSPRGPAGILSYQEPDAYTHDFGEGTAWGGQKVLIAVAPDDGGPALLRGQQLGGPDAIRFTAADGPHPDPDPAAELQLPGGGGGASRDAPGWRLFGTTIRLRAPGCYGVQIDGSAFSEVIVFQAEAVPPLPSPTPKE